MWNVHVRRYDSAGLAEAKAITAELHSDVDVGHRPEPTDR